MSTQEDTEPGTPVAEERRKCQLFSKGKENSQCWKKAALFFGSVALLLLIGLATSLGIFLSKSECKPPPRRDNSTTTYLGSASPDTQVTYVCQVPLLFPDNSPTFTLTCTDDLLWLPRDVPSCGIYTSRTCHLPDLGLTLTGRPSTDGLEIEIQLQGAVPPSLQVDIPIYDDSMCAYDQLEQEPTTTASPTGRAADVVVVVVFQSVDPWAPYHVCLRSIGTKLAVAVLQGDTTATILTSLHANTTTPVSTDTTDTDISTHHTTTSKATHSTETQDTTDVTSTADTTISGTT
ncbi:uncharacterized protein LOC123516147 isoform X2 [Portunus trituberculatus]|uniref:uncharacterized protein LOC123516147 isoform X2 n=1 Tax=Portunus trituberculatus TaxID=210409 RepID=UPI001E1D1738|nr:uncharacterized protein LOC123516147 isoform X2 [Portunus trituberculatus]